MQSSVVDTPAAAAPANTRDRAGKYLTFQLDKEEYGIRVLKVREIIGVQDITIVPQTPDFIRGVINLRGKVIPVVDLRLKFSLPEKEFTQRTCIIVVQVDAGDIIMLMGIIVDGVSEVLNLTEADIEETPDFGQGVATPYLLGMAMVKNQVKILLDSDQVLGEACGLEDLQGLLQ